MRLGWKMRVWSKLPRTFQPRAKLWTSLAVPTFQMYTFNIGAHGVFPSNVYRLGFKKKSQKILRFELKIETFCKLLSRNCFFFKRIYAETNFSDMLQWMKVILSNIGMPFLSKISHQTHAVHIFFITTITKRTFRPVIKNYLLDFINGFGNESRTTVQAYCWNGSK